MKRKEWIIKSILVLSMLCLPLNLFAEEEIRIGAVYPVSGAMALLGNHCVSGIDLATKIMNERGGIQGKKIKLVKADAPTAEAARSETERLINVENLQVILGTYSSSLSYVATAVADKSKRIYWETGGIADNITQRGFKYVFRTSCNASAFGNAVAEFIETDLAPKLGLDPKKMKLCVMHEDSLFGTSVMTAAKKSFDKKGIPIAAFETYSSKVTDLSSLVMKFKSLKPDIIAATCYTNDAILWQRQMKELNLNVKAMVGSGGGHGILDFAKATGSDSDGVFSIDFPLVKDPKSLLPDIDPPLQEVKERYKKDHGDYPDLHAMASFTGAWVLYNAVLKKAKSMNPEEIRKIAYNVDIPLRGTHMGWGVKFQGENDPETGHNVRAFALVNQWQQGLNYSVWPKLYAEKDMILVPLPNWQDRKK